MEKINPIPEGYHTLQPAINVANIDAVFSFVTQVFAAVELDRFTLPDGTTAHLEVKIGDSVLVLGPSDPLGPFPAKIFVYIPNVDEIFQNALNAGAQALMEPSQQFYGQRVARVKDLAGNLWVLATQTELVSRAEMQRRFQALYAE